MAVIGDDDRADARRLAKKLLGTLDYDKATINAAVQAIEDWFEANRTDIKTDVDAATSPTTMTNLEVKRIGAAWLLWKYGQEAL